MRGARAFGFTRTVPAGGGGGLATDVLTTEADAGLLLEDGTSYLLGDGVTGSPRVSQLDAAAVAAGANEFPLVQSGAVVAGTMSQLETLALTEPSALYTFVNANTASGVDPAVTMPVGTTSGDLLVYALSTTNGTPVVAGPEGGGWTILYNTDLASTDFAALAYKVAGGSEAASYAWSTSGGGSSVSAAVACFRGVDTFHDMARFRSSVGYAPSVLCVAGGLVLAVMHSTQTTLAYTAANDAALSSAALQSAGTSAVAILYRKAKRLGGSGGAMVNHTTGDTSAARMATGVSFV